MNVMEDLKAYLDGELSPERRTEIEAAMDQDERLRQELEEIRVLSRLIGDCVVEVEPMGLDATLSRLEFHKQKPLLVRLFREPRRFAPVWAMAAFILLAAFLPGIQGMLSHFSQYSMQTSTGSTAANSESAAKNLDASSRVQAGSNPASAAAGRDFTGDNLKSDQSFDSNGQLKGKTGARSEVQSPAFSDAGKSMGGFAGPSSRNGKWQAADGAAGGIVDQGNSPTLRTRGSNADPAERTFNINGSQVAKPQTKPEYEISAQKKSPVVDSAKVATAAPLLVRNADLTMQVDKVASAQTQVTTITKSLGGYVESSSSAADANGVPTAQFTLRVPEPNFEQSLARLRRIGKVLAESVTGQDVTAQVADTEGKLKEMRAEEYSYLNMLAQTKHVDDTLAVRDRLDSVRQQIASLESTSKMLRNQATYSTITAIITQKTEEPKPIPEPSWFDKAWKEATERASSVGQWLAGVGMNLLVLAPLWVPVVIGLWWLSRRNR